MHVHGSNRQAQLPSHRVPMQPVLYSSHMICSPWPLLTWSKPFTHAPSDVKPNGVPLLDYIQKYRLYFFNPPAFCFSQATTEQLIINYILWQKRRKIIHTWYSRQQERKKNTLNTYIHTHTRARALTHTHTHAHTRTHTHARNSFISHALYTCRNWTRHGDLYRPQRCWNEPLGTET